MPLTFEIDWEKAAERKNPLGELQAAWIRGMQSEIEKIRERLLKDACAHPKVPVMDVVLSRDPNWKPDPTLHPQQPQQPDYLEYFLVIALSTGVKSTVAVIPCWDPNWNNRAAVLQDLYTELGIEVHLA